jgi:hypothetical protein
MAEAVEAVEERIEWDSRRLHKFSIEEIQNAFAVALKSLTGKTYKVDIRDLNRHPEHEMTSSIIDNIDMSLRVTEDTGPSTF